MNLIDRDWCWALLLLPVVALGATEQDETLHDWLNRTSQSNHSLNYEGTFVYRCVNDVVTMKIVHAATNNGERERLMSLSGPSQHITHDGQVVTSVFPKQATRISGVARGALALGDKAEGGAGLDRFYSLMQVGEDRIAGRPTKVVEIKPRDQYRYGFKLWLDTETFLTLRSDMLDSAGHVVEQMLFTDITLLSREEAVAKVDAPGGSHNVAEADQVHDRVAERRELASADGSPWDVGSVPDGFALKDHVLTVDAAEPADGEHLLFSDGLASVSVFIEKFSAEDKPFKGLSRMGAVNAYGTVVNDHQVTVVGDVPAATVRMVGQSVTFRASQ